METRVKSTRQAGNCAQEQRFDPVGDKEPHRKEAVRTSSCSFTSSVQSELREEWEPLCMLAVRFKL